MGGFKQHQCAIIVRQTGQPLFSRSLFAGGKAGKIKHIRRQATGSQSRRDGTGTRNHRADNARFVTGINQTPTGV